MCKKYSLTKNGRGVEENGWITKLHQSCCSPGGGPTSGTTTGSASTTEDGTSDTTEVAPSGTTTAEDITSDIPSTEDVTREGITTQDTIGEVTATADATRDITTEDVNTIEVTTSEDATNEDSTTEDPTTETISTEDVVSEAATTTTSKSTTTSTPTEAISSEDPVSEAATTTTSTTSTTATSSVADTNTGRNASGCGGARRVRRNVKSLGAAERQRLVSAMEALIGRGTRYVDLANFHGGPPNICNGVCCPHGHPTFLPWHRLYMAQMEDELGEALPYWDWTEDVGIPDLWEGIRAPIKEGESSSCGGGQFVTRSDSIQLNLGYFKSASKDAFEKDDFAIFEDHLNNPHGDLHVSMGCDMEPLDTASYDTLFYLHHSYVDYQWAFWQELQRLRGYSDPTIEGFDQPLRPFESSRFNDNAKTLQNSRAQDTFDYQGNLCYEYDQLLFDGLTPEQFLQALRDRSSAGQSAFRSVPAEGKCGPVCQEIDGKDHCEEICSSGEPDGPLATVSVGVVLPRVAPSGINTFELCQDGKCVEAGRLGTFGVRATSNSSNDYQITAPTQIDEKNYFLRDTDVTAVVDKQGWTLTKPFEARMTSSVVGNLPDPVVIVKKLGEEGKPEMEEASLSPKENPRRYGNLIKKYSINNNKSIINNNSKINNNNRSNNNGKKK